jgi:hypothetical protein
LTVSLFTQVTVVLAGTANGFTPYAAVPSVAALAGIETLMHCGALAGDAVADGEAAGDAVGDAVPVAPTFPVIPEFEGHGPSTPKTIGDALGDGEADGEADGVTEGVAVTVGRGVAVGEVVPPVVVPPVDCCGMLVSVVPPVVVPTVVVPFPESVVEGG